MILFLAFYPGQRGKDSIIGEAIEIGRANPALIIAGAVSSAQAMPNYPERDDGDDDRHAPATFEEGNISIIRASRLEDTALAAGFGKEILTAHNGIGAIIHDKIVVIDPNSDDCTVIVGSHNLGYKASYSNDENLLIITGDRILAEAYAVHVLDVFDHYRFRALESDLSVEGRSAWSGFLATSDDWQRRIADRPVVALARYFARRTL